MWFGIAGITIFGIVQLVLTLPYTYGQSRITCLKGCICSGNWYRKFVDCSKRNLVEVPMATVRTRYLNLRGNNITKLKISDFDHVNYKYLYQLDLRDNPIENVASAVFFKLTYLRVLSISAKQLHHFAFHGLRYLTTLRIDGSEMTELHVTLMKPLAPKLVNLVITNTMIKKIDTHTLAGMKLLRNVYLQNNWIEDIGMDAFHGSPNLETVWLNKNKLKKIPKVFEQHKKLKTLNFGFNQIEVIEDDAFDGVDSLRNLDLSSNKLSKIEEKAFGGATRLLTVNLRWNQLKTMPTALIPGKCKTLRTLDLSYNKIYELENPSDISYCSLFSLKLRANPLSKIVLNRFTQLTNLDISMNCQLNFSSSVFGSRLNTIDLSETCLNELPDYFKKINQYRGLTKLNLHGNNIKTFTMTFPIRNLNLSSNGLENVTLNYRSFNTYNTFDFSHNKLTTINKGSRYGFMRMTQLILSNNSFNQFNLTWITKIRTLDLSYNNIEIFDSTRYKPKQYSNDGIQKLYLRGNKIKVFNGTTISNFKNLQILDLSENQIKKIDEGVFNNFRSLSFVNMSNNKLTDVTSQDFSSLIKLKVLDLSMNMITNIDENAFNNINGLQRIFLQNNLLQMLPMGLSKFSEGYRKFVTIDLSNNKISCSCDIKALISYYNSIQPVGSCQDTDGSTKPLNSLIMTFEELEKSKCNLCPMFPCKYTGTCTKNETVGFQCNCHEGFSGRLCDVGNVDCQNDTCHVCKATRCYNGGTCFEENGKATCQCQPGYGGLRCFTPSCQPNPCENNGTCFITRFPSTYKCQCQQSYFGEKCEVYHGYCDPSICNFNGICIKGIKPQCKCQKGYSGKNCEFGNSPPSKGRIKGSGSSLSSSDGDENGDMTSSTIGIIIIAVVLAIVTVLFVGFVYRHGYCTKSNKDDGVELQKHF